jgi:hypothetical protein
MGVMCKVGKIGSLLVVSLEEVRTVVKKRRRSRGR